MIELSREEARRFLLGHHRLNRFEYEGTRAGLSRLLSDLRMIQLDPLAPLGTSPDMVVQARCHQYRMGDLFRFLLPGEAFEHFAKERCLLPAYAFPYYRDSSAMAPWWRLHERHRKVPDSVLRALLTEVAAHGPASPSELTNFGSVEPIDWSGWKGTGKLTTMAMEILWTRCEVVVAGREGAREKRFDIPARALPTVFDQPAGGFEPWALLERVEAAGLLNTVSGPWWSAIKQTKKNGVLEDMIQAGTLVEVYVEGLKRRYLAPKDFRERQYEAPDDALRILGPLDAFLWDRGLIQHLFDFEYVWEVYKPARERRWGWYVCPLLHRGQLVGRLEGRQEGEKLVISKVWTEQGRELERDALKDALQRHSAAMGLKGFRLPSRFRRPAL